jgi:hypothetical protein
LLLVVSHRRSQRRGLFIRRDLIRFPLSLSAGKTALGSSGKEAFFRFLDVLETCKRMNIEGIVTKRRESAYRPGPTRDWLKIKTASWRAANRDRWEMFQAGKR